VDANTELYPPVLRHPSIALDQAILHLNRAADGVDDAAELDDCAVAGALDDAAVMRGDRGIDEIAAQPPDTRKRALFVGAGEPAVTDNIGNQNSRELTGFAHCVALRLTTSTARASNHRKSPLSPGSPIPETVSTVCSTSAANPASLEARSRNTLYPPFSDIRGRVPSV
jgi:hypothetical protein